MARRRIKITEDVLFPTRVRGGRRRVRALANENVHPHAIEEMRAHDWDVMAVADSPRLSGKDDHELYRLAAQRNRLLVTADRGFADDRVFPLLNGPGVLLLVGKTAQKQLSALLHAGPLVQFMVNLDKDGLPWNKVIASASKLRWRGLCRSGEFYDDVVWEATPRRSRTKRARGGK